MGGYYEDSRVQKIQLEAVVVFQISRHLTEHYRSTACGILLGMPDGSAAQITESFALPPETLDGDGSELRSEEGTNYQRQMVHHLANVGADTTVMGWYLSGRHGAPMNQTVVDNMYHFQKQNENSILLFYDVAKTEASGVTCLRAYRLSEEYIKVRQTGKFTTHNLIANKLDYTKLLEELPVSVHNSHLVNLLSLKYPDRPATHSPLKMAPPSVFERELEDILDTVEDFTYEQSSYNYYQRQLSRERGKISSWLQKRKAENADRQAHGRPLLPTDDYKSHFQLPEEPSRLDNLLLSAQLADQCDSVDELSAASSTLLVCPP